MIPKLMCVNGLLPCRLVGSGLTQFDGLTTGMLLLGIYIGR